MLSTEHYNKAVKEYAKNIFRYILKSTKDEASAKDIVQDCYVKLWEHKETVDHNKVRSWLFTTAYHMMINQINRSKKIIRMEGSGYLEPVIVNQDFDLKELIDKSLDELPPVQKTVILLRDLEGYNYKEIAEMLTLSEAQVKVYLFRGRQKIKNALKELHIVL
jgi:RNA polymerase sigma factor (sigma-70 family)